MRVILHEEYVYNTAKLSYSVQGLSTSGKLPNEKCAQDTSPLLQLQIFKFYKERSPTDGWNAHTF
jgi:hypothetical protein